MNREITIGEKYGLAMKIENQQEADAYFELCVEHTMSFGKSRAEAECNERSNLGYFAGYYDNAVRERVERIFRCSHPVFGKVPDHVPTTDEAFQAGLRAGAKP